MDGASPYRGRTIGRFGVDGGQLTLGRLPALVGSCSWGARVLLCPERTGFHAYRFMT